jgi:hypothetical protein
MILTAEEFFGFINKEKAYPPDFAHRKATEFAKIHVEAALKAAGEQADMNDNYYASMQEGSYGFIDKETILNAYSLDNIK